MKKILLSTGGSGGHVVPALNLYEHLKNDFDVRIYTDERGLKYIPKDIDKTIFEVKKLPEKKYFFLFKIMILIIAFFKSILHLSKNKYDIVISTGGYMSLPLVLASKLFGKNIFLFEPNAIIGRSNNFLLTFSNKILCYDKNLKGLRNKQKKKIIEIPPILNKCFYKRNISSDQNEKFKILIIGGSQASLFFSRYLKEEIISLASKYKIKVVQQLNQTFSIDEYKKNYDKYNVENNLFYFEENLLCKNQNFDIAISRGGASSLAELSHLNIPFIAIPFPYATDNHQFLNAKKYVDLNCCWMLEEKNFNYGDIFKLISQIMINNDEYLKKKSNLNKLNENKNWENINKNIVNIFK